MLNKLKETWEKINSKFIQAVSITAMAIIIILKPWVGKWNENLDKEVSELSKKNPNKEIIIQEDDNSNFNYTSNTIWSVLPDTNQVKNIFLNRQSLTAIEKQEFLELRNASKKNPNRDAMRQVIQLIVDNFWDENYKSIFICAFLDPFQTTSLGKQSFLKINADKYYKQYFKTLSVNYVENLELKEATLELEKSTKEVERLDEVSKMLQQLINIYKAYTKIFLFFV